MLYLNQSDVNALIERDQVIAVVEEGFRAFERGGVTMPDRINILDGDRIFGYMPCFTPAMKGTKVLTMYPDNCARQKPPVQGVMLLNNPEHGGIACIIDGAAITANRTAAVGAVGILHTAARAGGRLGLIGAGTQGFYQCLYAARAGDIQEIHVLDCDRMRAEALRASLKRRLGQVRVAVVNDAKQLLERSDIIITCTTSSQPVLPEEAALLRGKHFIGIGSYQPHMREFPKALFEMLDIVYIDAEYAKEETGDLVIPLREGWLDERRIVRLGQALLSGGVKRAETSLFKSVGMSYFDLCVAHYLYEKAIREGKGQRMV